LNDSVGEFIVYFPVNVNDAISEIGHFYKVFNEGIRHDLLLMKDTKGIGIITRTAKF
jgi:hypothetical protein